MGVSSEEAKEETKTNAYVGQNQTCFLQGDIFWTAGSGEEVVFLPTHTASNPCTGKAAETSQRPSSETSRAETRPSESTSDLALSPWRFFLFFKMAPREDSRSRRSRVGVRLGQLSCTWGLGPSTREVEGSNRKKLHPFGTRAGFAFKPRLKKRATSTKHDPHTQHTNIWRWRRVSHQTVATSQPPISKPRKKGRVLSTNMVPALAKIVFQDSPGARAIESIRCSPWRCTTSVWTSRTQANRWHSWVKVTPC